MTYQSKDLSVLNYANGYTTWHYTTPDFREYVLSDGYFNNASDMLRVGDTIKTNIDTDGTPDFALLLCNCNVAGVVSVVDLLCRHTPKVANSQPNKFIKNFQVDVHLQYQQMGSKLRNTVQTRDNVSGPYAFHRNNGTQVWCYPNDYYAGDWVNQFDELKENINERMVVAKAGAYALGRKTDELIISQLDTSTNYSGTGADGLTKTKVLGALEMLGEADVPDDGESYAIVGWKQWSDLLGIQEFANADYIGADELPWKGTQAKRWLGALWIPHSNLTKTASVRYCYWYHKTAIGHAIGSEVKSDVSWHGDRAAHFINNSISQAACVIEPTGIVSMRCLEV